jgi:hypothetical protein
MDKRISDLTAEIDHNPGISADKLRDAEAKLGISFPSQYEEFLLESNGAEGRIGPYNYLHLWSLEEILDLNPAYEVDKFAPGLLLIGSDGGDTAYAIDTRTEEMRIVELPFVGMDVREIQHCEATFVEFLEYLRDCL